MSPLSKQKNSNHIKNYQQSELTTNNLTPADRDVNSVENDGFSC